jgi:hypothetical protein
VRVALGLLQRRALRGKGCLGGRQRFARCIGLLLQFMNLVGELGSQLFRVAEGLRAFFHLRTDLVQLGPYLRAALAIALLRLRELDILDLGVVEAVLALRDLQAGALQRFAAHRQVLLVALIFALRSREARSELGATLLELLDLCLACEQAGVGRIGRMEAHGMAGELVTFAVDHDDTGGERLAHAGVRRAFDCHYACEPVRQCTGYRRICGMDLRG